MFNRSSYGTTNHFPKLHGHNKESFEPSHTGGNDNVLSRLRAKGVKVSALLTSSCGYCVKYRPLVETLQIEIVDGNKHGSKYNARGFPLTVAEKNGKVVSEKYGAMTHEQLVQFLTELEKKL